MNREYHVRILRTHTVHGAMVARRSQVVRWRHGRVMVRRIRRLIRRARRRARLRRDLERLDAHLLRDIGARREDLVAEAMKPFWRR